ncbi:MAG: T9SS type A sorting domain-containing protein [Chitinophagales bacterium]
MNIVDVMGRKVDSQPIYVQAGINNQSISLKTLQSGQYFIMVQTNKGESVTSKSFIISD